MRMRYQPFLAALAGGILLAGSAFAQEAAPSSSLEKLMEKLLAAYRTAPQGYPSGRDERGTAYAKPDTSVWFRWHFYNDQAIERFENARRAAHVEPYNPLEGQGASAPPGSLVKLAFVAEHVTQGKQALRMELPAAAVAANKTLVTIQAVAGAPLYGKWTASTYWPHYRWLKVDVHNPLQQDVRIRVCGVPFVLHPGANLVAVKTADASAVRGQSFYSMFETVSFEVVGPAKDLSLNLDDLRMEQELPAVIGRRGRMFQFPGPGGDGPVLWPGFTPVGADTTYAPERRFGWTAPAKTRALVGLQGGHRSFDHGLMWGACTNSDASFRVDLPNGRYGVVVVAQPAPGYGETFAWRKGLTVKLNGKEHSVLEPRTDAEVRQIVLGAEAWDFRPGACVWEALVRPQFFPPTRVVFTEVIDGSLRIELPPASRWHALLVFPEEDKEAALRELGRFNYLLAESWDVAHPWVSGGTARRLRYIGFHDEAAEPHIVPQRLRALKLGAPDLQRGFVVFQRGLTEAVYPDTIPAAEEATVRELRSFAARGERECLTLGLLPLRELRGLRCTASDLVADGGARIPAAAVELRVARHHQKTVIVGHHNKDYNYQEYYLVRRGAVELYPGSARRLYLDVSVPADAAPGAYRGQVVIADSQGKSLASVPLAFEVLPFRLREPPIFFACHLDRPELKDYGFNTLWCNREKALNHGLKGYISYLAELAKNESASDRDAVGKSRGFYSGYSASQRAESKETVDKVLKERPGTQVLGFTIPTYVPWSTTRDPKWHYSHLTLAPIADGKRDHLDADRRAGKEFWFADAAVGGHEQSGRFTFGFWLWKLGSRGRFSFLTHYGHGYFGETYYSLVGGSSANNTQPLMPALDGGWNPARSLILIREGIDDFRYIHTLTALLEEAQQRQANTAAVRAAQKFCDELAAELDLDLSRYYEVRWGSDGGFGAGYLHPLPGNPWRGEKFNQTRRTIARHIAALQAGAP